MSKGQVRARPSYFDTVRLAAKKRWDQLAADEELAAPWRQLFRQVQSPRHVISELLQNADDAGAKHVSVKVEDDPFIFEHDGHDFTHDEFHSVCRFGFSNKRRLLTIGFRGAGHLKAHRFKDLRAATAAEKIEMFPTIYRLRLKPQA
jgi:hypothetical protein